MAQIIASILVSAQVLFNHQTGLPPLVADPLTNESLVVDAVWDGTAHALVLNLRSRPFYELNANLRAMWCDAGVPVGVLIEHDGMTCVLGTESQDRVVGRTTGRLSFQTIVSGVTDAKDHVTLTIWFDLPKEVLERSPEGCITESWDIDCDGIVSDAEKNLISTMLLLNETVDADGFSEETISSVESLVVTPIDPCPR
jgi:hypothetical protein